MCLVFFMALFSPRVVVSKRVSLLKTSDPRWEQNGKTKNLDVVGQISVAILGIDCHAHVDVQRLKKLYEYTYVCMHVYVCVGFEGRK